MESKQRHGCVTAWLILMIIANSISAIAYLFMGDALSEALPEPIPTPMMYALAIIGIANLIFAIMLLQWKKWAFWAFVGSGLITLGINLSIGIGIGQSLLGLVGVGILYAILQIKKDEKTAWENLE